MSSFRKFLYRIVKGDSPAFAVILTLATQIVVIFLNILTGVITARLLGPVGRGVFTTAIIWPQFLSLLTFGIPVALVYILKNDPTHSQDIITSCLVITGFVGSIVIIISLIIAWYLMLDSDIELREMTACCIAWTIFGFPTAVVRQIIAVHKRFRILNISSWLTPLIYLIGLLLAVLTGGLTVWKAIIASCLPGPIVLIWMVFKAREYFILSFKNMRSHIRNILLFGMKTAPLDIISGISSYIDRMFLVGSVSAEVLGVYAVVFSLSRLVLVLQSVLLSIVFPMMTGRKTLEMKEMHDHAFRFITYVLCIGLLISSCFGADLVSKVYGQDYQNTGFLLNMLVFEAGLSCLAAVTMQLYLACGHPTYASATQAIGLAVACVALAFLVPSEGALGAAVALVIASGTRLVILQAGMLCYLKIGITRFYPKMSDVTYVVMRLKT